MSRIGVSDHAIVRYFERCLGIDMHEVKRQILRPENIRQVSKIGAGDFPIGDSCYIRVRDNVVVTVVRK